MSRSYELDADVVHYAWDHSLEPRLTIDPGDTVTFHTRDAADNFYSIDSTAEDVIRKGPFKGHPLTGPVHVRGAAPGDVLAVEIVSMKLPANFGWTAINPGRGLLPAEELPGPYLQIWDLSDGQFARMKHRGDIAIPIAPFPGVLGNALAESGALSTAPPRETGGNMDNKHLTVGSTVYLPVQWDGALFSTGDAHAAQGDGEACITAIETWSTLTLKFDLLPGTDFEEPRARIPGPLAPVVNTSGYYATSAQGPDLYANAQQAIRYMIHHLTTERGLSWHEAYVICSVAVDLKISEIVDAPNWLVSAFLPDSIFVG
ncbi:MAG: acetamidase/formamidase family protein [Rhodospirillales bacterium]|nr:acetamidase/formamidase family protein [Rhodospirillales bacterium]